MGSINLKNYAGVYVKFKTFKIKKKENNNNLYILVRVCEKFLGIRILSLIARKVRDYVATLEIFTTIASGCAQRL